MNRLLFFRYSVIFMTALMSVSCASSVITTHSVPAQPANITVNIETDQLVLPYAGGKSNLTHRSIVKLKNFLTNFSKGRPHSTHLIIVVPGGNPRKDIGEALQDVRIPSDNGVWVASPNPNAKKILIKAELYTAIPPRCKKRTIIGAPLGDNRGDVDIGCSNLANLARSVADAKDLISRDFTVLSNGKRATDALQAEGTSANAGNAN